MVLLPIRIFKAVYKEGSSASGRAGMGRDVGGPEIMYPSPYYLRVPIFMVF